MEIDDRRTRLARKRSSNTIQQTVSQLFIIKKIDEYYWVAYTTLNDKYFVLQFNCFCECDQFNLNHWFLFYALTKDDPICRSSKRLRPSTNGDSNRPSSSVRATGVSLRVAKLSEHTVSIPKRITRVNLNFAQRKCQLHLINIYRNSVCCSHASRAKWKSPLKHPKIWKKYVLQLPTTACQIGQAALVFRNRALTCRCRNQPVFQCQFPAELHG